MSEKLRMSFYNKFLRKQTLVRGLGVAVVFQLVVIGAFYILDIKSPTTKDKALQIRDTIKDFFMDIFNNKQIIIDSKITTKDSPKRMYTILVLRKIGSINQR